MLARTTMIKAESDIVLSPEPLTFLNMLYSFKGRGSSGLSTIASTIFGTDARGAHDGHGKGKSTTVLFQF
jgi:hypothetical protein